MSSQKCSRLQGTDAVLYCKIKPCDWLQVLDTDDSLGLTCEEIRMGIKKLVHPSFLPIPLGADMLAHEVTIPQIIRQAACTHILELHLAISQPLAAPSVSSYLNDPWSQLMLLGPTGFPAKDPHLASGLRHHHGKWSTL
jgi:hypothetical protein